ncbi:MAG: hypothetical protein Q9175_002180 [Cornicularia normoerica]
MSSQNTPKSHHAGALRLLSELQCLLDDPSPDTCSQAITAKWDLLGRSYHSNAEHLESRKKAIARIRAMSNRSGRQILALSGTQRQWERTFLFWQMEQARADLDGMDRKCVKLKGIADKWGERARREDKKVLDFQLALESDLEDFLELHLRMEDAEGKIQGFWARERWCLAENDLGMDACAEEMRKLESWRCWPVGRLCEGEVVGECLMGHEHE